MFNCRRFFKIMTLGSILIVIGYVNHINLPFCVNEYSGLRKIRSKKVSQKWELKWIREYENMVAFGRDKNYLQYLNEVKSNINPEGRSKKVYYLGIGPYRNDVDIMSPLLATGFTELYAVDWGSEGDLNLPQVTYRNFKRYVKSNLSIPIEKGVIKNLKFSKEREDIFKFKFSYKGRKRNVKVYYGKDTTEFVPSELSGGYEVLYTRWTPSEILNFSKDVEKQVISNLDDKEGYFVTDSKCLGFDPTVREDSLLDKFTQKPLEVNNKDLIEGGINLYLFKKKNNVK